MKILSLETTSEAGSVAFLENDIKYEFFFECPDIASRLVSSVESILEKSGVPLSHIDYFAVSNGPGSWTGTRLGLSFALGLAGGDKSRIHCVSSPHAIFFGIRGFKLPAVCLINAYSGKMYVSYFNGRFYYGKDYSPEKVSWREINEIYREREVLITGPGISILPDKATKLKKVKMAERYFAYPRAGINGLLAMERIKRRISSLPLKPYYG